MKFWRRKLLALLHDPPSKAFNLREHEEIAASHLRAAGFHLQSDRSFFDKVCDHAAAAADRIIFPKPSVLSSPFQGRFHHPLGEGRLVFSPPIEPDDAEAKVAKGQPQYEGISNVEDQQFPGFPARSGRDWANFFLHWRLWPYFAAEQDPRLSFLPADTRIPDHTIWTHCAITSALQGCVEVTGDGPDAGVCFSPAFLLMQVGPVQEFIAQARKTRDLWSGSYLLSFLMAHGLKAITDRIGPDAILFPSLRGQPLFDWLHKKELYDRVSPELWQDLCVTKRQIRTPNLPNRFLALVPSESAKALAEAAEASIRQCLKDISEKCLDWFDKKQGNPLDPKGQGRWREQVDHFLSIHWQTWPWAASPEQARLEHEALFGEDPEKNGLAKRFRAYHRAAQEGIPRDHLDPRNYRHRSWKEGNQWTSEILFNADGLPEVENPGFAWSIHYSMVDSHLAARRNTRDFPFWGKPEELARRSGLPKDVLSGKEESVGGKEWLERLEKIPGHLFRPGEILGAMNLIKRVWHKAYLEPGSEERPKIDVSDASARFDSVPDVAAADWVEELRERLEGEPEESRIRNSLDQFGQSLDVAKEEVDLPDYRPYSECKDSKKWIDENCPSLFHESEIRRWIRDRREKAESSRCSEAARNLKRLYDEVGSSPRRYVAVLALDGDSMGKWLSGENLPPLKSQLSSESLNHFSKEQPNAKDPKALSELKEDKRLLTPSFHLELSTALANFAIYLARPIVESFQGELIYAGGDDVLAMLPARNALRCASLLRKAFRGDPELHSQFPGVLKARKEQWGFVGLDASWKGWKSIQPPRDYHILVPGRRADLSAGIAIGHMYSPLQNLMEAARAAEKRAKSKLGYGRSAFAISLFKRSGEILQWGAKWESSAIGLSEEFARLSRKEREKKRKLSGRFPYALAALLRTYSLAEPAGRMRIDDLIAPLCRADLEYVVSRQAAQEWDQAERNAFFSLASRYLEECREENRLLDDFLGPFLTEAFLEDQRD